MVVQRKLTRKSRKPTTLSANADPSEPKPCITIRKANVIDREVCPAPACSLCLYESSGATESRIRDGTRV